MWVGEQEENGGEGVFCKIIGQELHAVGTGDGNVLKRSVCSICAKRRNAISDVLRNLDTNLQPCVCAYESRVKQDPKDWSLPSMSDSGKRGARATKRPPKPQPMSANSGILALPK